MSAIVEYSEKPCCEVEQTEKHEVRRYCKEVRRTQEELQLLLPVIKMFE